MRREGIRNAGQSVGQHRRQRGGVGEMGVKMRHRVAQQVPRQVARLEEASEDRPPTKTQGVEKGLTVPAGVPAQHAQVGVHGRLPVAREREIGDAGRHLRDRGMDRLAVRVLDRKNAHGHARSLDGDDLIENKCR